MFTRIKLVLKQQKSRLAGFFLSSILLGCQPPPELIPGAVAYASAQQSLQASLPLQATEQFATAIRQGNPKAITPWLDLTQHQFGPLQQYQQLQAWGAPPLASEEIVRLGLWQDTAVLPPVFAASTPTAGCQLNVQPVLSSLQSIEHWLQFKLDWPTSDFAQLPVCFLPPIVLDGRDLRCNERTDQRISCDPAPLSDLMQHSRAQILLVAAGRGQASFNNGWLQVPEQFSPALFRHEFSHALGFLDEYPLSLTTASAECVRADILPNLVFDIADAKRYAKHWQLEVQQLHLTPVETCRAVGVKAWRPVLADSHMQHFELAVPVLYQHIMHQQLNRAELLMPVQYYFAYLARQQQEMQRWQQLMRQAAAFGYPAARSALQAAGVSLTAR